MADVVLLYERTCPNVALARAHLVKAFARAGVPASWREVDLESGDTPPAWRTLGSPTILVDGHDVVGAAPREGASCRLYEDNGTLGVAPPVAAIAALLGPNGSAAKRRAPPPRSAVMTTLAAAPSFGVALLPKVLCPACWPGYAAALSVVGLGWLLQERYLLPITIAFVAMGTFALAFRARRRRGYAPAALGAAAGVVLLVGKFAIDTTALAYAGAGIFAAAALWNAWPLRRAPCPACIA